MLQLEEARERILAAIQPLAAETVLLSAAARRFLASDVVAPIDLPPFDNSAVDGYAVRAEDTKSASQDSPMSLRPALRIPAGADLRGSLQPGTCARIFTGSPLPTGADAVVMQEDVTAERDEILFREPGKPWENVRLQGEDVKSGSVVLRMGEPLAPGAVALLGALGLQAVAVCRRPVVEVLGTGDELQETGAPLGPGRIYESNRAALASLLERDGAIAKIFPLVSDNLDETRTALRHALETSDAVITTGGVSVGELDFVKEAFTNLGGDLDFWRVAIKPGKPFVFGKWEGKFLFGLPGNPVSAFVTALMLVRPAILRWQGAVETRLPSHPAVAAEAFTNRGGRRHFMRVRVDNAGRAHLTGAQASHLLVSLAHANGLVDVPPNTVIEQGAPVEVMRFDF
ncbi:MAG: molybdopterin molybdotransferase MoeA [Verrucomicrobia subdivision 3 bacterium]|nr:molybdopterin molybdotransferase MoeA [Limisphaerales bacterium]